MHSGADVIEYFLNLYIYIKQQKFTGKCIISLFMMFFCFGLVVHFCINVIDHNGGEIKIKITLM